MAKMSLRRLIDTLETKSPEGAKAWVTRVQQLVAKWREDEEPHRSSECDPDAARACVPRNLGGEPAWQRRALNRYAGW
jgi:hypothetical protein